MRESLKSEAHAPQHLMEGKESSPAQEKHQPASTGIRPSWESQAESMYHEGHKNDCSVPLFQIHRHLQPDAMQDGTQDTGTWTTTGTSRCKSSKSFFPSRTSRTAVGRVSLMIPFAFVWEGTNSTHKEGLQGQERVSGSLMHITLCHWHMPRVMSAQHPGASPVLYHDEEALIEPTWLLFWALTCAMLQG